MKQKLDIQKISRSKSLSAEVTEQLHELITSGQVAVGEKLPSEHKLCDLFGVSRTVIREAISQLKSIGMLDTHRGRGAIVVEPDNSAYRLAYIVDPTDIKSILYILELRMSIETMAAEFAALRHSESDLNKIKQAVAAFELAAKNNQNTHQQDYEIHLAIAKASQNPYYLQLFRQFHQDAIPRMKALNVQRENKKTKAYIKRIHKEHLTICSAIEARDAVGARTAMYEHLDRSYQIYSNAL